MASFFGIQTWFHKPVTELSGGQKQLLALASIMVLTPSALILDEPTSQLDPIAASEFLATVGKINRELGVTVVLTEHRLEEAFPLSSRAVVMDGGRIIADGLPRETGLALRRQRHGMFLAMPTPMRVWAAVGDVGDGSGVGSGDGIGIGIGVSADTCSSLGNALRDCDCPVTVRDGVEWLASIKLRQRLEISLTESAKIPEHEAPEHETPEIETPERKTSEIETPERKTSERKTPEHETAVKLDGVWFRYEKNLHDVIKDLSFKALYGEITAILGGNGTGKTTALSLIAVLNTPYRGRVTTSSDVYALPQNPQSLFTAKTVREDLLEMLSDRKLHKDEKLRRLAAISKLCRLDGLLDTHPYDLSGGEQQRAALAKVLLLQPKILLLDEPTKGLDAEFKQVFAAILRKLTVGGTAVVIVSHDIEFCAQYADRCALFFDGSIVTENTPRAFFSGNSFYTTAANRMARAVLPEAITAEDLVLALGGRVHTAPELQDAIAILASENIDEGTANIFVREYNYETVSKSTAGGFSPPLPQTMSLPQSKPLPLPKPPPLPHSVSQPQPVPGKNKLPKRTAIAAIMILLTIPLTIFAGFYFLGDRRYYFISMLIILQTMLPFALVFESRKPQARELVVIAVLCAIAVAGRAAFFMLPQVKPVTALVIIAGVAFGGEAGFLVGAMSGFVSNMFFGQGSWTPWQMFSFGIIGFLAGALSRKGLLSRAPASLAAFGAITTFIVYGFIMDASMIVLYQTNFNIAMLLAAIIKGMPFNLIHSAATMMFLALISRPMLEKLDRIKLKYGLVE
jgi:energy-coupling factor transport system ATP-binding protein